MGDVGVGDVGVGRGGVEVGVVLVPAPHLALQRGAWPELGRVSG